MVCSFAIKDNNILGGGTVGLYIEALSDSGKVVGRKCTIKIYEVDNLGKKRGKDDLLAVFSSVIYGNQEEGFYFTSKQTERIDEFENELPEYEYRESVIGYRLSYPLNYTPPYFKLFLDSKNKNQKEFTIIIQNQEDEMEYGTYEIGFTVELEEKIVFDSRAIPAYVECHNLLSDNCNNAIKFITDNHYKHQQDHLCGLYVGSMFPYLYGNKAEYIKHIGGRIEMSSINKCVGIWDEEYKKIFDKHNERFKLKKTDCFTFVNEVMEIGFKSTGMIKEWEKYQKLLFRKMSGQILAKFLTDLGWVALYYSPDVKNYYDLDLNGTHARSYRDVLKYKQYGNSRIRPIVPVHDIIVNYSPTIKFGGKLPVDSVTPKENEEKVHKIMNIPFAFILGRYGCHTALLSYGQICEVHWKESCYSEHLFDKRRSFLFDQTEETWDWLSGVIVTPKIFWETEDKE